MGVPLLFLLLAFEYRQKLEFAYVNSESSQTEELRKRYSVHKSEQVFFIMKEEPSHPEIILKVKCVFIAVYYAAMPALQQYYNDNALQPIIHNFAIDN